MRSPPAARPSLLRPLAAVALAGCALSASAQGSTPASPQVLRERVESLQGLLAREPRESIAEMRRICAFGRAPAATARSRSLGAETQPDAADRCATVLLRTARERALAELYRDLVGELGGDVGEHAKLPAAIATTVLKTGSVQVPIGNARAATVTGALAFDSGFTLAYEKGERATAAMPELVVLKSIAERCLASVEPKLGLCYSTGYVYGARAVTGLPLAGL